MRNVGVKTVSKPLSKAPKTPTSGNKRKAALNKQNLDISEYDVVDIKIPGKG